MAFTLHQPLVSIALATYNGEKYLNTQIDSLLNQTYKNIEIIVVDDCSTDNTFLILQEYINNKVPLKIFKQDTNSGVNATFNYAIKNCTGDFIACCDQDDIWMPNKIELLLYKLIDAKEDAIYHNSLLVDSNGKSLGKSFAVIMKLKSYYSGAPFLLSNCIPGHTLLFKKNILPLILPIPTAVLFDQWIGFNTAATNGILYEPLYLVHYRQHSNNVIGTKDSGNVKNKKTKEQEFNSKLLELKTLEKAHITNAQTIEIVQKMVKHFHKNWSFARCLFFFKYYNQILQGKNKSEFRKVLFCFKMFFKPNF